jgi:uncharacterized RmlC-like cupin family protein
MASEGLRVIRDNERSTGPSTTGMIREEAVATDGMWAGYVRTEPRMASGWHHHGDYESAIYVISGQIQFEFGTDGRDRVEAGPGDFVYVPKGAIHRELNPQDDVAITIVVRSGTGEALVNVDGPEGAD